MASNSFDKFNWNIQEVGRLEEAHDALNHDGIGRRALGHITKSALVMLCAAWEVYIEDVILESIGFINNRLDEPSALPIVVKKKLVGTVNNDMSKIKDTH